MSLFGALTLNILSTEANSRPIDRADKLSSCGLNLQCTESRKLSSLVLRKVAHACYLLSILSLWINQLIGTGNEAAADDDNTKDKDNTMELMDKLDRYS